MCTHSQCAHAILLSAQRERRGWTGDAQTSSEEAMLNYDMQLFYTKYLDDIRAAPVPDSLADCWAMG